MSLNIGKKVYRTLQEQVGYNSERIEQIADYLDGLDVQDSVIVLEGLSPLNSEQMKVAEQPLAFIVYNEAIYLKTKEDATYYYFEKMLKMELNTYVTLSSAVIQVTKLNGATGITTSSVNVYSTSQVDTSLGLKANVTYVDTELAKKANLSGADFTGGITAPNIIEVMEGYSFSPYAADLANFEIELEYVGAVKTGNKLTLVIAGKYSPTAAGTKQYNMELGEFILPESIADKIVEIDSYHKVCFQQISFFSAADVAVNKYADLRKSTTLPKLIPAFRVMNAGFTNGSVYAFRFEQTFLLGPNLVN